MSQTPRKSPVVLVVEDDVPTNMMIQAIMTQVGFQAVSVYCVNEAIAQIERQIPDIVLMDVNLPDGSGFDVCHHIQHNSGDAQIPVLFISSHEDTETKVKGFEAGGVDYITKPIARAELIARVSTHLRLKQAFESLIQLQAERIQKLTTVQESLMPQSADYPDAKFQVSINQILKAGGDFYDVVPAGGGMVDYLVADVSGHDLSSSLWTSSLKTLVAEYVTPANSPIDIFRAINRVLCRVLPSGTFFTAVYARINRKTNRISLVNAAHPPPVILHRKTGEVSIVSGEGDVLGAFADAVFEVTELPIARNDRLFLYSDGLVEMDGPRENGVQKVSEIAKQCLDGDLSSAVLRVRSLMAHGKTVEDDILVLGVDI